MSEYQPTICIDFDGVIHSYTTPFAGKDIIPDEPILRAAESIQELMSTGYYIAIFTTRATEQEGKSAVRNWCIKYGIPFDIITAEKIPALIYVDDRALRFEGNWTNTLMEITTILKRRNK